MTQRPKVQNAIPENIKKKYSLANSRNILNHGQVRFTSAKCAEACRNYGNSLVIREVFSHLRPFEKQF